MGDILPILPPHRCRGGLLASNLDIPGSLRDMNGGVAQHILVLPKQVWPIRGLNVPASGQLHSTRTTPFAC